MKTSIFLAMILLTGCHSAERLVPEDWYRLPENGGSGGTLGVPSDRFGGSVEKLFEAYSTALEPLEGSSAASVPARTPVDWVPWRLAGLSTDFALTVDGTFGALLAEGVASVTATWLKDDDLGASSALASERGRKSNLVIRGTATPDQVARELEPTIRAALSTGRFRDEGALRRNVLAAASDFRAVAGQLSSLKALGSSFAPTAFRLEIGVNGDGQITPVLAVGAEINLRFDWMIQYGDSGALADEVPQSELGRNLETFVRAVAPDLDAAAAEARKVESDGYAFESVRIEIGPQANGTIGIASGGVNVMGGITFGSDRADCYDPDGDGDCHQPPHPKLVSAESEGSIALIDSNPKPEHLSYASSIGAPFAALKGPLPQAGVVYQISHRKFREGIRKAVRMGQFFAHHAAKARHGKWRISEIESEFDLSLSGTVGLVTVGGTGELELEFIHKKEL
jgi:hypothetical protein